jgi:hypothetical protein
VADRPGSPSRRRPKTIGATLSRQSLQLGLFGVIMPGVAQVAPAFNLFSPPE